MFYLYSWSSPWDPGDVAHDVFGSHRFASSRLPTENTQPNKSLPFIFHFSHITLHKVLSGLLRYGISMNILSWEKSMAEKTKVTEKNAGTNQIYSNKLLL